MIYFRIQCKNQSHSKCFHPSIAYFKSKLNQSSNGWAVSCQLDLSGFTISITRIFRKITYLTWSAVSFLQITTRLLIAYLLDQKLKLLSCRSWQNFWIIVIKYTHNDTYLYTIKIYVHIWQTFSSRLSNTEKGKQRDYKNHLI